MVPDRPRSRVGVRAEVPCGGLGDVPSTRAAGAVLRDPSAVALADDPSRTISASSDETARSVWLINASTGHVNQLRRVQDVMRSGITALCVDETGGAVWAGDEDGKVFAISSTRRLATTTAASSSRRSDSIDERSSEDPTGAAAAVARHPRSATVFRPPRRVSPSLVSRARPSATTPRGIVARVKPPCGSGSRGRRSNPSTVRRDLRATRGAAVVAFFRDGTVAVYRAPIGAALENLTPVSAVVHARLVGGWIRAARTASPPRNQTAPLRVSPPRAARARRRSRFPRRTARRPCTDAALAHGSVRSRRDLRPRTSRTALGDVEASLAVGYAEAARGRTVSVWRPSTTRVGVGVQARGATNRRRSADGPSEERGRTAPASLSQSSLRLYPSVSYLFLGYFVRSRHPRDDTLDERFETPPSLGCSPSRIVLFAMRLSVSRRAARSKSPSRRSRLRTVGTRSSPPVALAASNPGPSAYARAAD